MTRLGVGLMGLYAVLALISWWTTRALRRHAADHEHQALHDPLTGLPNRELFRRVAEESLARGRTGDRGALVLVDLDHFKEVNDTLGHHAGDELLKIVGQRLSESLRTDDTVARLGGDEFGIVLPHGADRDATVALLSRVREELSREITLDGAALSVEASFGVCFYPDDADTVEGLLQHADAAMYRGKHVPTGVVVYEPTALRPVSDALVMQRELRRALESDELVLHYQPKIELGTGRVTSVEALVRWQHPERGLLPPAAFLPVAERSELIEPLTRWVLAPRAARLHRLDRRRPRLDRRGERLGPQPLLAAVRRLGPRHPAAGRGAPPTACTSRSPRPRWPSTATSPARSSTRWPPRASRCPSTTSGSASPACPSCARLDVTEIKIDRTFVAGPDRQRAGPGHRRLGHRAGPPAGLRGDRRGRRDPGRGRLAGRRSACDHAQGYLWLRPAPWTQIDDGARAPIAQRRTPGRRRGARGHRYDADRHLATARRGTRAGDRPGPDRRLRRRDVVGVARRGAGRGRRPGAVRPGPARPAARRGAGARHAARSGPTRRTRPCRPSARTAAPSSAWSPTWAPRSAGARRPRPVRQPDFMKLLPDVVDGRIDLAMSAMTDTAQRARTVDFVNYFSAGTAIVVQRGNPDRPSPTSRTCADVRSRSRPGPPRSTCWPAPRPTARASRSRCGPTPTNSDALVQLRTGRAAAVLNDLPPAVFLVNDPRTRSHYQLASTTQYEPGLYGIVVSQDQRGLRDAVQGACEQLLRSGAYADVLRALEGRRRGRRPGQHRLRPLRAAERPAREGSRPATGETRGGSKENDTRPSQLVRTTGPPADPSDHGDQRHTPPGGGLNHRRNSFDAPGADG